jgi:hypothetical protein
MNPQFLKSIVNGNEYVQACTSNKAKDVHSLSSLVDRQMSQSDCIKLGTGLEKVFSELVLVLNPDLTDIKPKNSKGKKERDHLFANEKTRTIFYAELKSNLNLDTEKCKSTTKKCLQIETELAEEYPDYIIKMFLVGLRYLNRSMFPSVISFKYEEIDDNKVGVNDYFDALTTGGSGDLFANEQSYREFLTYLADQMFE